MSPRPAEPSTERPLDPVLDFMRLLWSLEHGLQRTSKRMEHALGLTGPQRLVLKIVASFPGLSAGELAHILQLHPSTITGILQRLVAQNLLVRDRDARDLRRVRLRVGQATHRRLRSSRGTVEEAVGTVLARVPRASMREARTVLKALAAALNDVAQGERPGRKGRLRSSRAG